MGYLERARLGQIWQPWYAALMEQGGLVGRVHEHIVAFSALFMPLWYHCSLELGKRSVASVNASMEQLNCVFCKKHVPVLYIIQVLIGIEVQKIHCLPGSLDFCSGTIAGLCNPVECQA